MPGLLKTVTLLIKQHVESVTCGGAAESQYYGRSTQCGRPVGAQCLMGFGRNPLINGLIHTSVSEGFFLKCSAIFFRQEIVNQKLETHPVKSYITKQLLINGM